MSPSRRGRVSVAIDGRRATFDVELRAGRARVIDEAGRELTLNAHATGERPLLSIDGRVLALDCQRRAETWWVGVRGAVLRVAFAAPGQAESSSAGRGGDSRIAAIMPGRVVEIRVRPGDRVERGTPLLVVEAMKMQNEILAPRAGVVQRVLVAAGENVERDAALVEIG